MVESTNNNIKPKPLRTFVMVNCYWICCHRRRHWPCIHWTTPIFNIIWIKAWVCHVAVAILVIGEELTLKVSWTLVTLSNLAYRELRTPTTSRGWQLPTIWMKCTMSQNNAVTSAYISEKGIVLVFSKLHRTILTWFANTLVTVHDFPRVQSIYWRDLM